MRRWIRWMCLALPLTSAALHVSAQALVDVVPTPQPIVTVTASATSNVANDRMHAFLRAEVDNADATQAANDVNARMARALTRARAVAGVEVSTAGYSSYQVTEQNRPPRWRVAQTLVLESGDFAVAVRARLETAGHRWPGARGLEFHGKRHARAAPRKHRSRNRRSRIGKSARRALLTGSAPPDGAPVASRSRPMTMGGRSRCFAHKASHPRVRRPSPSKAA